MYVLFGNNKRGLLSVEEPEGRREAAVQIDVVGDVVGEEQRAALEVFHEQAQLAQAAEPWVLSPAPLWPALLGRLAPRDEPGRAPELQSAEDRRMLGRYLGRTVRVECQLGETAKLAGLIALVSATEADGPDPLVEYAVSNLRASVIE